MQNDLIRQTLTQEIQKRIKTLQIEEIITLLKVDDDLNINLSRLENRKEEQLAKWKHKVQIALIQATPQTKGFPRKIDGSIDLDYLMESK